VGETVLVVSCARRCKAGGHCVSNAVAMRVFTCARRCKAGEHCVSNAVAMRVFSCARRCKAGGHVSPMPLLCVYFPTLDAAKQAGTVSPMLLLHGVHEAQCCRLLRSVLLTTLVVLCCCCSACCFSSCRNGLLPRPLLVCSGHQFHVHGQVCKECGCSSVRLQHTTGCHDDEVCRWVAVGVVLMRNMLLRPLVCPHLLTAKRTGSEGCVELLCACCVCVLLCALTYLLPSGPEVRVAWSCCVRVVSASSCVPSPTYCQADRK
jgi:hypothetical protein